MEKLKKTFKIKYHIFQYNVILNTLINSNNKKFKDHLHIFFNKTNVMYKWPTESVFLYSGHENCNGDYSIFFLHVLYEMKCGIKWTFVLTLSHQNYGTGSTRKWTSEIMHQTIPCGRDSTLFRVLLVWVHTNFLNNNINYTVHASMSSIHI